MDSKRRFSASLEAKDSLEGLKRQNHRLSILYDLALTVGRSLELKEILDDSLDKIINFMGADSGVIYSVNDLTQELVPVSFVNLSALAVKDLCENRVKIGECMCGKIAECEEEVIIYEKASTDDRFTREVIKDEGMEFYAGLPLKAKGKVNGVLCIITHAPYTPDDELIDILRAACVPLSLAIENARIFQIEIDKAEQKVRHYDFRDIITVSPKMNDVLEMIRKVTDIPTSILITGESGTGKELIARAIHYNSLRQDKPFITVNCAAIPETLLESEFFGNVKGAFTDAYADRKGLFESADGGTIFMDEINSMSSALQAKLLRVFQDNTFMKVGSTVPVTVDIRIITATNQDLKESVKSGSFREDLFYRLYVFHINVPPLRERKEDIPILTRTFMNRFASKFDRKVDSISSGAMESLMDYDWPGNIRELENAVERGVAVCDGPEIKSRDLPHEISSVENLMNDNLSLKRVERAHIQKVLVLAKGNKKAASDMLGINASTLWRKLK